MKRASRWQNGNPGSTAQIGLGDLAGWLPRHSNFGHGAARLARAVGGFNRELRRLKDWDLWLRLSYHGCRMEWTPPSVCAYRVHRGQMVRDESSQSRVAVVDKFFAQPDLPPDVRKHTQHAYAAAFLVGAFRAYGGSQTESGCEKLGESG